jgi:hypothetical protein
MKRMNTKKIYSREVCEVREEKLFYLRSLRVLRETHQFAKSKSEQLMK